MAKLSLTTVDNFDDNALDTTNTWNLVGTILKEQNQRIEITQATITSGSSRIVGKVAGDLTGDAIWCHMTGFRDGANTAEAMFGVQNSSAAEQLRFNINNGNLLAQKVVSNVPTNLLNTVYYPDIHYWMRIRESAGTTYWDTAPNTASNPPLESEWVNRVSAANPIVVTSVYLRLHGGTYNTSSVDPGTATFDGVNTAITLREGYSSIQYVGTSPTGGVAAGDVTSTITYHASTSKDDLLLMELLTRPSNITVPTPSGWQLENFSIGGTGDENIDDQGSTRLTVFSKIAVGNESGNSIAVSNTGGSTIIGAISTYRKPSNATWQPVVHVTGAVNTPVSQWNHAANGTLDVRPSDIVISTSGVGTDVMPGSQEEVVMGSDMTFSSNVEVFETATGTGRDGRMFKSIHYPTSGSANVIPNYKILHGGTLTSYNPTGPFMLFRVRATEGAQPVPVVSAYASYQMFLVF